MDLDLIEIENIDNAINHFKSSSTEDLYNFLKTDNDILKQIALLHLTTVSSQEEAELIVNTLINHPSETREYCSFLINRLFQNKEYKKFAEKDEISIIELLSPEDYHKCSNIWDMSGQPDSDKIRSRSGGIHRREWQSRHRRRRILAFLRHERLGADRGCAG